MYKLLIVDDEQIVTDSIQFIVKKFMHDPMMTETAHSGREAIEKAVSYRPDFVIIDIKMPGISGLEAIREIKRIYSGALFIVISAFAKFDYAKEAIQLGVIEYINKPLTRDSLISALNNAMAIREQEQSKLKSELDYKEKMAYVRPALENSFIYYIMLSDGHTSEIRSLKTILGLDADSGYVMTVESVVKKVGDGPSDIPDSDTLGRNIYPILRETVKEVCEKSIIGSMVVNRVVICIPCNAGESDSCQKAGALDLGARVYEKLRAAGTNVDFHVGIGKRYLFPEEICKSYEESVKAVNSAEQCGVMHICDVHADRDLGKQYPQDAEKTLLKKTASGETDAGLIAFESLFDWFSSQYGNNVNELKSGLIRLVVMLFSIPDSGGPEGESYAGSGYIKEFMSLRDRKQVKAWMKNAIRKISGAMPERRKKELSPAVRIAVDYIAQNYTKNITLEDVSSAVKISPTYFSKMFKEEVGSTFIDYLTMMRIGQAKRLIRDGSLENKEICDVIGYSDPNYFSRVFKKIVGVTPTEYRSSLPVR